ncbi:MAG: NYN domain-containing protein [Bacteroidetes bacterium]|nr:NYN domain-containing protein [Bacteroidota bacterium]
MNTIIIDGNNLLHKIPSFKKSFSANPDSTRRTLVEAVKGRIKNKAKIIFVFDGHCDDRIQNVIFSGAKTADEVIRKFIEDNYDKNSIKVVSSDREITSLAKVCGCEVSTSEKFWEEINSISLTKGKNINQLYLYDKSEKPNGISRKDFNEFLKHFT